MGLKLLFCNLLFTSDRKVTSIFFFVGYLIINMLCVVFSFFSSFFFFWLLHVYSLVFIVTALCSFSLLIILVKIFN